LELILSEREETGNSDFGRTIEGLIVNGHCEELDRECSQSKTR